MFDGAIWGFRQRRRPDKVCLTENNKDGRWCSRAKNDEGGEPFLKSGRGKKTKGRPFVRQPETRGKKEKKEETNGSERSLKKRKG